MRSLMQRLSWDITYFDISYARDHKKKTHEKSGIYG